MSSEINMKYAVHKLIPNQYVYPPDGFRCCPNCGGKLSKSDISPSKAVTNVLDMGTIGYSDFSNLYECTTCHWWAVWESFGDAEGSFHAHYLIASLEESNQSSQDNIWSQVLDDKNVYGPDYTLDMPLTKSLEQVLEGGKRRILNLPRPGDKVLLVGDVHSVRNPRKLPFELTSLFIAGSEGSVVSTDELHDLIKNETKEEIEWHKKQSLESKKMASEKGWEIKEGYFDFNIDQYLKGTIYHWGLILDMMNCCPVRLEKLIVQSGKERQNLCKKGEIYLIDAANIQKI